jgi:hypothetical protein
MMAMTASSAIGVSNFRRMGISAFAERSRQASWRSKRLAQILPRTRAAFIYVSRTSARASGHQVSPALLKFVKIMWQHT